MTDLVKSKREYVFEFSRAESELKDHEHQAGATLTGSINELRYAGKHASTAIEAELNGDPDKAADEWLRAIRHTQRARYDVLEARVLVAMEEFGAAYDFYEGYEDLAATIIPHYFDHKSLIREVGKQLSKQEETGLDKDSPEYRDACTKQIEVLEGFLEDFYKAQPELLKAMGERERQNTNHKKAMLTSWITGALFCLLSVALSALVAWCVSQPSETDASVVPPEQVEQQR